MHYAHSLDDKNDKIDWHRLQDHLYATGELAAQFAREFGGQNAARLSGRLHDLGKYSTKFQARLSGSPDRVDHSTAGAKEVMGMAQSGSQTLQDQLAAGLIAYAIAGHHAGLADFSNLVDRLERTLEPLDEAWRQEIDIKVGPLWPGLKIGQETKEKAAFQLSFLGRMIFSCLVDADYKDTEAFYAQHEKRIIDRQWPDLREDIDHLQACFDRHMQDKSGRADASPVNALRNDILVHVRGKATEQPGLFTLTVPTGGGKTLASLGFALDHAKAHNLRRIVYAIPFTSIIEQSAAVFRSVLGNDYVLEHHSSIDEEKNERREQKEKLRLAMEDWAAPVIVTTNVQLFESLFANRPSHCRKLHNLAHSVIILDEAQTMPLGLLRPCLAALDELAKNYGASIILCTATQPAVDKRQFKHGGLDLEGRELAPDPVGLARQLKRTHISAGHELDDDALVSALEIHPQALVIVNSRKHALSLYQKARQAGLSGLVHLTTRQHAAHRREILAEVKQALINGIPCRLIATSLVEAGVDVDFPRVWRAESGLDQIAQAAGRCNREGQRPLDESIVTVFTARDNRPPREIAQLAADFSGIAPRHVDLLSPAAMQDYFNEVYWRKGPEQLDHKKILEAFSVSAGKLMFNYQTAAADFRMIESGLVPVIINDTEKTAGVLGRLCAADASPGKAARELQSHIVQIPPRARNSLVANGRVIFFRPDLWGDQFAVLEDASLYRRETGLVWEDADYLETTIF